ncbi:MAG: quinoprotein relay system zinc metallohydrolase 2 [Methylophilaceae bacterium]|jgi:quinoprotein relay system zinc metallohydrolase 2
MKKKLTLYLFFLTFLAQNILASSAQLNLIEVASGIFVHQGAHLDIDESYQGDICNIGFIIGKDSVAVIDTGGSLLVGESLKKSIREKTSLPIKYVINTHVHLDHIYGNAAFNDPNTKFVGHSKLPKAMQFRKNFYETLNLRYLKTPLEKSIQIPPSILVRENESKIFDLGEREIKVNAYSPAHTDNDVTITDIKTGTLWAGDLLFIERTPVIDGDIHGFIDVLGQLISLDDINLVIPGHGTPTRKWRDAFRKSKNYFITLRDDIRRSISEDQGLRKAIETVAKSESKKWELFDVQNARNINQVYPKLEWE